MDLLEKIKKLKKEKNAIILTHCYQPVEIDEVSDYVGDSFYLSKKAAETDADIIVFAGVHFMAQSAKLLNPNKKVLLPNPKSGCFMADMIGVEELRSFKAKHPNIPAVCYINSTAEIKAECDICCTSSNAINVVQSLKAKEVLFLPDTYLGKWVEEKLKDIKVITYNGFCPTHLRIRIEDMENARKQYPNAKILAHPECHTEVAKLADFVGSTKEIMEYARTSNDRQFVIATERGVVDRLKRDYPEKEFILIKDEIVCQNMKWNSLEDIYNSLLNEEHEIEINETIVEKATKCIKRMMEI
ncbi:MAG: quinolinate synthase NadA [Candidatus Gastranaerophilales bacterium]|nr:quinolinate synthase NadA [Candidatus Gastranaerophilales bacterium]MCM1073002.1 quinolinate synthase NadA [Bacteroides sp.]